MPLDSALIHSAELVRSERVGGLSATRNPQGEYTELPAIGEPDEGVSFPARLMLVSGQRTRPEPDSTPGDTAQEIVRRFEWLAAAVDDAGEDLTITASDQIRFLDAGPLGAPTVSVSGQPELLNDGTNRIGWWGFAVEVLDTANA